MAKNLIVGDWLVEPDLNRLSKKGQEAVQIEPKVMEVLLYLAEHTGRVLSKERLIQAVWPDTFVSDEALWHAISSLRQVFGDDPKNPRMIQTVPKKGYRLIAPCWKSRWRSAIRYWSRWERGPWVRSCWRVTACWSGGWR